METPAMPETQRYKSLDGIALLLGLAYLYVQAQQWGYVHGYADAIKTKEGAESEVG